MNFRLLAVLIWGVMIFLGWTMSAQPIKAEAPFRGSAAVEQLLAQTVQSTFTRFAEINLKSNELAVTLVWLNGAIPEKASYRGDQQIYPASGIKLFYLVAAHQWLEEGKIDDTPELRRAMRDMIVHSYNEATHYVVDLLTGTTSGPELPAAELEQWFQKRNAVNRYFASLGYKNVVANRKPWCEGPYGREQQSIKIHAPGRNFLSTDDTAQLLTAIIRQKAVSPKRSAEMMTLLKRDLAPSSGETDSQVRDFTGAALPPGAKLWSKAGWTSSTRHDAAYIEIPEGPKFVLVTFTVNHANERRIIPFVAQSVIAGLAK